MLDRRSAHAERAIDDLRKKFGNAAVIRGIAYDGPEKAGRRRNNVIRGASDEQATIESVRYGLLRDARKTRLIAYPHLQGLESLTSNLPSAPEMTKSL